MSRIWEPQDIDVYRSWHEAILNEASDDLNDWETRFLDNIGRLLNLGIKLTQSQAEKLEQIYAAKTK